MDESYVIILDSDEDRKNWVYVAERVTSSEIEAVQQYLSTNRQEKSKAEYDGEFKKNKSLVNTETGNKASGKIYKLTKKEEA